MCSFHCFSVCDVYAGDINTTFYGLTCQRWDAQSPHQHENNNVDYFPDVDLSDAANHCRNPDGSEYTYCYTTDEHVRWQYCDVPGCSPEYY